jgi:hypothetical protein
MGMKYPAESKCRQAQSSAEMNKSVAIVGLFGAVASALALGYWAMSAPRALVYEVRGAETLGLGTETGRRVYAISIRSSG